MNRDGDNLKFYDYLGYIILLASFPIIIFISYNLIPNKNGVGTHEELGLPPCGFYTMFHKPCPSCGMTTCFALLAHLRLIDAIKIQPAGVFLFFSSLFVYLTIPYHFYKRKRLIDLLELDYLLPILIANVVVILLVWFLRLWL